MTRRKVLRSIPLVAVLATASAGMSSLVACSKPPPPRTTANVKAGDLHAKGDWTGVFYSPLYGHLHLVKEGNAVSGKWRTTSGDRWGELNGQATGDLLKYKWREHKIGMMGPSATTEGRGYFKYHVPAEENSNHEIRGEWGLGRSEVGNPWKGIRQRNMLPDMASVAPDETERVDMADQWDTEPTPPSGGGSSGDDSSSDGDY